MEFMIGLLAFCMVMLIWAALGHAMWLLMSAIGTALFGEKCASCGRKHGASICPHSAAKPVRAVHAKPSVNDDLAAARRLLEFSKFHKWLTPDQHEALEQLVQRLAVRVAAKESLQQPPATDTAVIVEQARTAFAAPASELPGEGTTAPPPSAQTPPPVLGQPPVYQPPTSQPATVVPRPLSPKPLESEKPLPEFIQSAATRTPVAEQADQRTVHPLEETFAEPPRRPPVRQKLTAELLKSFMEQSNIRWVELISAALIVVCSVGLVISLWSTLSSTSRFFPSLVFLLATVAVHGAGQYTLKQWKLRTTSRGILHIGLMLIPLAMLVGILLSRRGGALPTLDWMTVAVFAVGTTMYTFLAVTASRSLFPRNWQLVAALTIVSSLTLVPIHYLAEQELLRNASSTLVLVPLAILTLMAALWLSLLSHRLLDRANDARISTGRLRRLGGMVTQCLFAVAIAFVFWIVQAKGFANLTDWWFVALGIVCAAWSSWGWSASVAHWLPKRTTWPTVEALANADLRSPNKTSSWFMVAAWFIATACTLTLASTVWQVALVRITLVTLLASIAGWWLVHGWLCKLRASLLAGAAAAIGAVGLTIELAFGGNAVLKAVDWLSFERIISLSAPAVVALVGSMLLAGSIKDARTTDLIGGPSLGGRLTRRARRYGAGLPVVVEQFQLAGAATLAVTALLTVLASLLPSGDTPYGGNWAGSMLLGYGALSVAAAIVLGFNASKSISNATASEKSYAHGSWMDWLMPVGLIILLLGAVRLCQTSPMLEELLGTLRPARSWAIGTGLLALLSAVVGRGIKVLF
ncbi:MAG: hypothetical protein R3C53_26385 [Pirellulaceae bacterium]